MKKNLWKWLTLINKVILWLQFITLMKIYSIDQSSPIEGKLTTLMKTHGFNKNRLFDENTSLWWNVITLMKIHYFGEKFLTSLLNFLEILYSAEKFLNMMENGYVDGRSWLWLRWKSWWKFMTIMKLYQFGKNSLLYLKVFNLLKISNFDETLFSWWKFIT